MSVNPVFAEIWNRALGEYLTATGHSTEDTTKLKTLQNTDDLVQQLEIDQGKFGDWRRHSRVISKIKQAISPFRLLSQMAISATSVTPFGPASALLGAVLFLVKAADGVSEAYNSIEELFGQLGEFAQRLAEYLDGGMSPQLEHKVVEILCCLLGVVGRSEKVIRAGRFRKYATVLFLGQDEHVKELLNKLRILIEYERSLVTAASYANTLHLLRRAESIEATVKRTQEDLARQSQESSTEQQVSAQRVLLEKALDHPARSKNALIYSEYSDDALTNSGEWLLKEKEFQDWMERKSPLLWIRGGPGTGKSFLSAIIMSKLRQTYPQGQTQHSLASIGFFYVKGNDQDLQNLHGLLKTIVWQLISVDLIFRDHVIDVISQPEKILSVRKLWEDLFVHFYCGLQKSRAAFIVIDGLDEAPKTTIKDFFHLLDDLPKSEQGPTGLSLALFGRPELGEYIDARLERAFSIIDIGGKNEGDIDLYVRNRLKKVLVYKQALRTKTKSTTLNLAKQIRERIIAKADGMFFKVVLIMDSVEDRERLSTVFEVIEEAPVKLEEMIGRIFQRLSASEEVDNDDLKELLSWVAFSRRPLTIAELYAILRNRTGQPYDVLEARLKGRFASLFKLTYHDRYEHSDVQSEINEEKTSEHGCINSDDSFDENNDDEVKSENNDSHFMSIEDDMNKGQEMTCDTVERFQMIEVRFSHSSIRDFLVNKHSESLMQSLEPWTGFDVDRADLHLTLSCMRSILDDSWDKTNDCNFLSYAAVYFMDHLISAGCSNICTDEKQPALHLICQLFYSPIGVRRLIKATTLDFNRALHMWFESPSFSKALQNYWFESAAPEHHATAEFEWMKKAADLRTELFKPLATEAGRLWLVQADGTELKDDIYEENHSLLYKVWIVHCYLNMDVSEDYKFKNLDIGGLTAAQPPVYELEPLEAIVRFAELPETPHWHTSYAWILLLAGLEDEALDHFEEALQVEHSSWRALQGKAKCLAEQGNFENAICTTLEALKTAPNEFRRTELQWDLTAMYLAEKDFHAALEHSRILYHSDPTNGLAIVGYVASLYALHKHDQVVTVLQALHQSQKTSQKWDNLQFLQLRDVHHEIGCSFRTQKRFELLRPWLDPCILKYTVGSQPKPWLTAWIGEFAYSFLDDVNEATRIFEHILSREFKAALGSELMWSYEYPRNSALNCLSQIYQQNAVSAYDAGKDTQIWISKLKKLDSSFPASSIYESLRMNTPPLFLGVYLRLCEGAEESTWKPCFRDSILQGIELLDKTNCWRSSKVFFDLGQVLLAAGKRSAAIEAMSVALTYSEAVSKITPVRVWSKTNVTGEMYGCSGPCTSQFHRYKDPPFKELYLCEYCVGTAFCEDCISIAKDGKLPFRKCDPRHSFIQVLPILEEARNVAAWFIDNGESMEISNSWISAIRDEWL